MSITVLIADDQEIVRNGLRTILDAQPDIEVVGTAADGRTAVDMARQLRPDVCLFDIRMPQLDGISATQELAGRNVTAPYAVVIITTFDDDEYVHAALEAGARGFLLKDSDTDLLVRSIRAAADGDAVIAPAVTARLLQQFSQRSKASRAATLRHPLTVREEEVLVAVARGLTNAEIAQHLHISLSTAKAHVGHVMTKLDARNRVEIAAWAYETGRVEL